MFVYLINDVLPPFLNYGTINFFICLIFIVSINIYKKDKYTIQT